jgi:hypothetical protein
MVVDEKNSPSKSFNNMSHQEEESLDELVGVYIKAFCSGVNEILTVYKEHLLAIEHEYLKDRSLTI